MRKLISGFLIIIFALPAGAFAQTGPGYATLQSPSSTSGNCNPTGKAPNDPANCAFTKLSAKVTATDKAGYKYPYYDPAMTPPFQIATVPSTSDMSDTTNNADEVALLKANPSCNPVVWASLVQQGRQQVIRDVAIQMGIHNQTTSAMNNKCTTKLGPNGEDRTQVEQAVRNQIEADLAILESAICTLNWQALLKGFFGLNISICKNGQIFSAGITSTLSSTFLLNGKDPFHSKDCMAPGPVNANLMQQGVGAFGTNALNGSSASSINFNSGSAIPMGSNGGWSFGIGVGGSTTGGTTTGGSTSKPPAATTTTTPPPPTTTAPPTTVSTPPTMSGAPIISNGAPVMSNGAPSISNGAGSARVRNPYE